MIRKPRIIERNGRKYFFRFTVHQRIQHVILFSSVILLSLTGFPLRYHDKSWAEPLYSAMGGHAVAPMIHRLAGTVLLLLFVYHTCYWLFLFFTEKVLPLARAGRLTVSSFMREFLSQEMVPNKKDLQDLIALFKYVLYISPHPPQHERMSWKEKFDYYAPYWGIPILGPAGFILWWRDEFSHVLPGIVYNAAYIMHTDEALLAALFLFGVHWYNVHYAPEKFPMARVFISGYLPEDDMVHEHYAEYVRVMTAEGRADQIRPQH